MKKGNPGFLKRQWRGLYLKMIRQGGSPEYAARGAAIGLFIGFLIPMGLQLLIAIPLAFLLKGSKVLASTFTFVTNHFTIIFIYPIQCLVGSYLLLNPLSYSQVAHEIRGIFHAETLADWWHEIVQMGVTLAGSFLAGGFLFGILAAVAGYFLTLKTVAAYQQRKALRRAAKAAARNAIQDK